MAVELEHHIGDKYLEVRVTGKLSSEDYAAFVPAVEKLIGEHGKIRILFVMCDFHGWHAGALWEDLKFDIRHFGDIDRLAVVGEKKWQKGMSVFCKPFTRAVIRYFEHAQSDAARAWLAHY